MRPGPHKPKPQQPTPANQVTADYGDPSRGPVSIRLHKAVALGSRIGKYKIDAVLGHGGMGSVYGARDPLIGREVAIKILPPELVRDPATLERFLGEARAAGRLNHPNVVTIYEVIEMSDGGGYAIVMERVNGGSVQNYLQRQGTPGWRAASRLIGEACKALSAAHDIGLIHRDIKPANLLLTKDGHVKVADFGLAKVEGPEAIANTQPGAILGTPAYMSPEQCRGDKIDRRSDIYSLGCTYFAMLTNKPPFEAASSMQVMFAHCSAPVPDPRTVAADAPDACVEILRKALAKDPQGRYESAKDFLADLRALLGGGTINSMAPDLAGLSQLQAAPEDFAHTPSPIAALRHRANNRPWIVAGAAASVAIVLGGILVMVLRSPSSKPAQAVMSDSTTTTSKLSAAPLSPKPTPAAVPTQSAPINSSPHNAPPPPTVAQTPVRPTPIAPPPPPTTKPLIVTTPMHVDPPTPAWRNDANMPATLVNSVNISLRLIHPGEFEMGDSGVPHATPHRVTLTQPFYIGEYEISFAELNAVMGDDARGKSARQDLSAPFITWDEANEFCQRLSNLPAEREAGRVYRLPTEAEWEYACRAGSKTRYAWGSVASTEKANFGKSFAIVKPRPDGGGPPEQQGQAPPPPDDGNGPPPSNTRGPSGPGAGGSRDGGGGNNGGGPFNHGRPGQRQIPQHPIEPRNHFQPNAWGLYDMEGGLWEWCSDFYAPDLGSAPQTDPPGLATGSLHTARGGSWASPASEIACASRNGNTDQKTNYPIYGFRIVCQLRSDTPAQ